VGDKVTLGQVSLRGLRFLPPSSHPNGTLTVGCGLILIQSAKET